MPAAIPAIIGAGVSLYAASETKKSARAAEKRAREERDKQNALLEEQKEEYAAMKFTNPYAGMENQYAENVYEDLTVNQQQAQFEAQQGAQQRANILGGLRGAAGTSGIAGLAQSLAGQGQLQAQRASASIGQQEAVNQRLAAQGAQQRQTGAAAVDLSVRGGEADVQAAESGRQATFLGIAQGQAAGATAAATQASMNRQAADQAALEMQTEAITGLTGNMKYTPGEQGAKGQWGWGGGE